MRKRRDGKRKKESSKRKLRRSSCQYGGMRTQNTHREIERRNVFVQWHILYYHSLYNKHCDVYQTHAHTHSLLSFSFSNYFSLTLFSCFRSRANLSHEYFDLVLNLLLLFHFSSLFRVRALWFLEIYYITEKKKKLTLVS